MLWRWAVNLGSFIGRPRRHPVLGHARPKSWPKANSKNQRAAFFSRPTAQSPRATRPLCTCAGPCLARWSYRALNGILAGLARELSAHFSGFSDRVASKTFFLRGAVPASRSKGRVLRKGLSRLCPFATGPRARPKPPQLPTKALAQLGFASGNNAHAQPLTAVAARDVGVQR